MFEFLLALLPGNFVRIIMSLSKHSKHGDKSFVAPFFENSFRDLPKLICTFSNLRETDKEVFCMDVGSNVGLYASAMIEAGFNNVQCFEPNPEVLEHLKSNLQNFEKQAYSIHKFGIMRKSRTHLLKSPDYAFSSFKKKTDRYSKGTKTIFSDAPGGVECDFKSYEDFQHMLPKCPCALIKIDVEGSEYEVVRSLLPLISKDFPLIYIEMNPVYQHQNKNLIGTLCELGYCKAVRVADGAEFSVSVGIDLHDGKDYVFSTT